MVTKNELKYIRRLNNKSERIKNNQFVVEGEKSIKDFLSSDYILKKLFSTHPEDFNLYEKTVKISLSQLKQISFLKSPNKHLGVFEIKNKDLKKNSQYILLDSINDPGNLGTIIRSAEWFGFKQIICSKNSVDCYNPKVVQSSMGSLSRVDVIYTDLIKFIRNEKIPVFGTSTDGKSILEFSKNINSKLYEMSKDWALTKKDHIELQKYSQKCKIDFFSTPFGIKSAKMLEEIKVPLMKVASGEVTNEELITYLSKMKIPLLVSTGMTTISEIAHIVEILKNNKSNFVLLHCVSSYPTLVKDANLATIPYLKNTFNIPVGFSDHTTGIEISLAAVALGACVIEKHFTLDKNMEGPDQKLSLDPSEYSGFV